MAETVSLKEHMERLREADQKAVSAALAAAEKAVSVAEINAEKWRMNANEWREAMNDRERNFLSKGMGYVVGALSAIALLLTIFGQLK
jgi:hypothetical protein